MYIINSCNVTIMVADIDSAVNFYTAIIGMNLKQRWGNYYAMVEAPGLVIGLHPANTVEPRSKDVSIGFLVNSLAEAEQHLQENNIVFTNSEGPGGKYAHFTDPWGTALYFMKLAK